MEALSGKTVLLVTHQVDFLPAFNSVLVSQLNIFHLFLSILQGRYNAFQIRMNWMGASILWVITFFGLNIKHIGFLLYCLSSEAQYFVVVGGQDSRISS